jgi:hypothetical protein
VRKQNNKNRQFIVQPTDMPVEAPAQWCRTTNYYINHNNICRAQLLAYKTIPRHWPNQQGTNSLVT